jgi:Ca-activated chloride channel family protein
MRLASPEFLLLFALFPAGFFILRWYWKRRGSVSRPTLLFGNFTALTAAPQGLRSRLAFLPGLLRVLALAALVVALARPQSEDWQTLTGSGMDIVLCLDMSASMNAVDMGSDEIAVYQGKGLEPSNRFEVAKTALKQFVANRKGDRIGLVVFASEAYLKFPLTLDYATVLKQLDGLALDSRERRDGRDGCTNNCTINGQSTAIGDALSKAYKRLEQSDGKTKVIVLVTDGNNNSGKLEPMDVARYIGDQPDASRIRLYTFLLGSSRQTKMPVMGRAFSGDVVLARSNGFLDYEPIQEGIDEAKVKDIAEAAQGVFHVSYDDAEFLKAFEGLEKTEHQEQRYARYTDLYMAPALLAAGLLLLELLLAVTFLRRYP